EQAARLQRAQTFGDKGARVGYVLQHLERGDHVVVSGAGSGMGGAQRLADLDALAAAHFGSRAVQLDAGGDRTAQSLRLVQKARPAATHVENALAGRQIGQSGVVLPLVVLVVPWEL